jgi:tripeptide aminopeptidase
MKERLLALFTEIIQYETTSDESATCYPSTENQELFAEILAGKLATMGLEDVAVDEFCYVTATLPSNTDEDLPVIGFISHMDTSPDCCGRGIRAMVVENYDGGVIERKGENLSPEDFPILRDYVGKTVICSDGTTLLGADDKAGVTEIITAVEYLMAHDDIKHGKIRIAFTPDEEIGAGVDHFDVEKFGCDFAYTVDGGVVGEISYENFNAARAKISIHGRSVHPGSAKGKMVNAGLIATEFNAMLPNEIPANTEGYEGFYHLCGIEGRVEEAHLNYIIRDFDAKSFEARKETVVDIVARLNKKYGEGVVSLELYDEYRNMREVLDEHQNVVDRAIAAIEKTGVKPLVEPIRGGTDGARLSFMNLPCPNLFTGGHNFHGPFEFVVLESMEKAAMTIVNIAKNE